MSREIWSIGLPIRATIDTRRKVQWTHQTSVTFQALTCEQVFSKGLSTLVHECKLNPHSICFDAHLSVHTKCTFRVDAHSICLQPNHLHPVWPFEPVSRVSTWMQTRACDTLREAKRHNGKWQLFSCRQQLFCYRWKRFCCRQQL